MKRLSVAAFALLLIAGVFIAGSWHGRNAAEDASGPERRILYYVDPMNAMNRYDRPGKAPCGMDLEPVYEDDAGAPEGPRVPGTVHVGVERQQLIGVRTGLVRKDAGSYALRVTGRVAPDETGVYPINASIDGRIIKTGHQTAGSPVRRNETLATYFTPEVLKTGRALLAIQYQVDRALGLGTDRQVPESVLERAEINLREQLDILRDLGMGEPQINEMIKTRKLTENIKIFSPVDGFVLSRDVSDGQLFGKGAELYRIADLTRVWILADVYEDEVVHLRPGMEVRFSLPRQGRWKPARVSDVLPQFDPDSRTMKVRLEADNKDLELRPDMFVDVEIPVRHPEAVVVPSDAVIDSGMRKTVYVDRGSGYFEPRLVETGWRHGSQVEIVTGLSPGERVVLSANFLIDSESKLRAAAEGIFGASHVDPVCGMDVDEGRALAAGRTAVHGGKTYFFCADSCREEFLKDPGKYPAEKAGSPAPEEAPAGAKAASAKPAVPGGHSAMPGMAGKTGSAKKGHAGHEMPAETIAPGAEKALDPVCRMTVDRKKAKAAGLVSEHQGAAYYFCTVTCKQVFDANPQAYAGQQRTRGYRDLPGARGAAARPAHAAGGEAEAAAGEEEAAAGHGAHGPAPAPGHGAVGNPPAHDAAMPAGTAGVAGRQGRTAAGMERLKKRMEKHAGGGMPAPEISPGTETAVDPVCGMTVDKAKAVAAGLVSEHGGTAYYFCVESCKRTFDKARAAFLEKQPAGDHQGMSGSGSPQ